MIKIKGAAQSTPCILKTRNKTMVLSGAFLGQFGKKKKHLENLSIIMHVTSMTASVKSDKGKKNNSKKDFPFLTVYLQMRKVK